MCYILVILKIIPVQTFNYLGNIIQIAECVTQIQKCMGMMKYAFVKNFKR